MSPKGLRLRPLARLEQTATARSFFNRFPPNPVIDRTPCPIARWVGAMIAPRRRHFPSVESVQDRQPKGHNLHHDW
jgi:hypothetical protein